MEPEMFVDEEQPDEWDMDELLPELAEAETLAFETLATDEEMWAAARRWASQPAGWRAVTLILSADEHVALNRLATEEERQKNEMAEVIVRRELRRRGLL